MFDTAKLVDGHLYQLDQHLDRLLASAEKAGVAVPQSLEQMYRTVLETAAASCVANGAHHVTPQPQMCAILLRVWCSEKELQLVFRAFYFLAWVPAI